MTTFILKIFVLGCYFGLLFIQLDLTSAHNLQRPNIVFILADDLGWNDVSFHGSPQIPTPNLDALASSGVILNNHYGECLCTPSRGALMTGKYPIRLGLQHFVIRSGDPAGLPLNMKIMPQYLKEMGYDTHMVGKWHLGYMRKEYTPIFRGFNTFFGPYGGMIDYYDYTHFITTGIPSAPIYYGMDLRNGTELVLSYRGTYATHAFSERATDIIKRHNTAKPLFLYLSSTAPHTGNRYMPLQAPPNIVNRFNHIKNDKRKVYAAMVSALDDLVGSVVSALHQKDMLKNSVVVFASDNGGELSDQTSSNFPLRGWKFNWWEGGVRVPALVWSPLLGLDEPRVSMQLMHMSDWLPTLFHAAGGNVSDLGKIDGHDMWNALKNDLPSPRRELLQALDPVKNVSVIRKDNFKLVSGNQIYSAQPTVGQNGFEDMFPPTSMDKWVFRRGSIVKDILEGTGLYLPKRADLWRLKAGQIRCKKAPQGNKCDPNEKPCLFNILADPCENNNVAEKYPEVVTSLMRRIEIFKKVAVKPQSKLRDLRADPRCHNFTLVPWMDAEHQSNCPFEGNDNLNLNNGKDLIYTFKGKTVYCEPFTPLECYRIYFLNQTK